MSGAVISPSQEDENTFLINFISGEHYKMRASSAKERQIWVDRLRHCVMNLESVTSRPVSGAVVCLLDGRVLNFLPLSSMDTFKSVYGALYIVFSKKEYITKIIETLSFLEVDSNKRPSCDNNTQLMIKVIFDALVISFQRTLIHFHTWGIIMATRTLFEKIGVNDLHVLLVIHMDERLLMMKGYFLCIETLMT